MAVVSTSLPASGIPSAISQPQLRQPPKPRRPANAPKAPGRPRRATRRRTQAQQRAECAMLGQRRAERAAYFGIQPVCLPEAMQRDVDERERRCPGTRAVIDALANDSRRAVRERTFRRLGRHHNVVLRFGAGCTLACSRGLAHVTLLSASFVYRCLRWLEERGWITLHRPGGFSVARLEWLLPPALVKREKPCTIISLGDASEPAGTPPSERKRNANTDSEGNQKGKRAVKFFGEASSDAGHPDDTKTPTTEPTDLPRADRPSGARLASGYASTARLRRPTSKAEIPAYDRPEARRQAREAAVIRDHKAQTAQLFESLKFLRSAVATHHPTAAPTTPPPPADGSTAPEAPPAGWRPPGNPVKRRARGLLELDGWPPGAAAAEIDRRWDGLTSYMKDHLIGRDNARLLRASEIRGAFRLDILSTAEAAERAAAYRAKRGLA